MKKIGSPGDLNRQLKSRPADKIENWGKVHFGRHVKWVMCALSFECTAFDERLNR